MLVLVLVLVLGIGAGIGGTSISIGIEMGIGIGIGTRKATQRPQHHEMCRKAKDSCKMSQHPKKNSKHAKTITKYGILKAVEPYYDTFPSNVVRNGRRKMEPLMCMVVLTLA